MEDQNTKERLVEFIRTMGLSVAQFERRAGLSNGYVRNFKGVFGSNKLDMIANAFPRLNRQWMMTGKGEMLKDEKVQIKISDSEIDGTILGVQSEILTNDTAKNGAVASPTTDATSTTPQTGMPISEREQALMAQLQQAQAELQTLRAALSESQQLNTSLATQVAKLTDAVLKSSTKKR